MKKEEFTKYLEEVLNSQSCPLSPKIPVNRKDADSLKSHIHNVRREFLNYFSVSDEEMSRLKDYENDLNEIIRGRRKKYDPEEIPRIRDSSARIILNLLDEIKDIE